MVKRSAFKAKDLVIILLILSGSLLFSSTVFSEELPETYKLLLQAEDFKDSSPQNHILNYQGSGVSIVPGQGKWGSNAFWFDGSDNSYLSYAYSPDWEMNLSSDYTIDFWILPDQYHEGWWPISVNGSDPKSNWTMQVFWGGISLHYSRAVGTRPRYDPYLIVPNGGAILSSEWQHVAFVKKGDEYAFYVDGVQVNYGLSSDWFAAEMVGSFLMIGGRDIDYRRFKGYMDEIRIVTANHFNANPNTGLTDTITVPTEPTSTNNPPTVDAGPNMTIGFGDIPNTQIQADISDADGDELNCKLTIESPQMEKVITTNGKVTFNIADILCTGTHTLTIEASDEEDTATGSMQLTIGNSTPVAIIQTTGSYRLGYDIELRARVFDFEGDSLTYKWYEGTVTYGDEGFISTYGEAVDLPVVSIPAGIDIGEHTITLEVSDGYSTTKEETTIIVIDSDAPTLAPVAAPALLWPPDGQMHEVVITANAEDNSGGLITLSATIESDDGDVSAYSEPVIDQATGIIDLELRADFGDGGIGKTYTVTIIAEDENGNTSQASVNIVSPPSPVTKEAAKEVIKDIKDELKQNKKESKQK